MRIEVHVAAEANGEGPKWPLVNWVKVAKFIAGAAAAATVAVDAAHRLGLI